MDNLLPFGLTLGPNSPEYLDSFITPFHEKLKLLEKGVTAYDRFTRSPFVLKAHLVLLMRDTSAVSKLLHLSGHTSIYPCRACNLEGTPSRFSYKQKKTDAIITSTRYYYPPRNNVNRCTFESYCWDRQASINNTMTSKKSEVRGVSGISPFTSFPSISIPDCSPFDVMHLVYLCFTRGVHC